MAATGIWAIVLAAGDRARQLPALQVPPSGWTDLGPPERVRACLAAAHGPPLPACPSAPLVLARRFPKGVAAAGGHVG